jgi:hypothetical protein
MNAWSKLLTSNFDVANRAASVRVGIPPTDQNPSFNSCPGGQPDEIANYITYTYDICLLAMGAWVPRGRWTQAAGPCLQLKALGCWLGACSGATATRPGCHGAHQRVAARAIGHLTSGQIAAMHQITADSNPALYAW